MIFKEAAISNTVAKGISFTDGIKIHKGPLTISTSASVNQKVGNDKNGTVAANMDVSSEKKNLGINYDTITGSIDVDKNGIKASSKGVKIQIADNNYYNSELSIGGTSFSNKSAEVTLVEHSIQTKPAANNMTSEIKTSVSVNTDTLKKVGTVAAGVAIVAGSAYAVAQTGGFSYPAVASTLALGLAMVKTGFTR